MSSVNIDQISKVITRLNEIIKTPVCSTELTRLSKLIQEANNLNKQFEEAGRLQKRGLKKSLEDAQLKLSEAQESCLQCIFDTIVSVLKPSLDSQIQSLSSIAPRAASLISNLSFPLTSELMPLTSFIEELAQTQKNVLLEIGNICNQILQQNKTKIQIYSNLISLNPSYIQQTKNLTKDALNVMKIDNLLDTIIALNKESELIDQQLASSSEAVQQKLISTSHELNSALQEGIKRNILSDINEYQGVEQLASEIENANSINELNAFNTQITNLHAKYSTTLRSAISKTRTSCNNIIVQVRSIFPSLSDEWMPTPPEFTISGASVTELISYVDEINNWKERVFSGIKRIASMEELNQVTEGALHEGVMIPNTLLANARESSNQVQMEGINVEEAFRKLRNFHTYYNQFLDILRDEIRKSLAFEATDSDSSALISLKPPIVNLTSDSPLELLSHLRSVNIWKRRLINVLQEARHAINDTIATVNQLKQKGINNFPPNFENELKSLYEKMASETDVQSLLLYRRSYDKLVKQFVRLTAAFIKDYLKDVVILQLLESDEKIPRAPFVEDASELDLSELLERIDIIEKWKVNVLTYLKNKIEAINFPLIPGEVPIDLRKEKSEILTQMTGIAAARNSIATFKSYFKFLDTISSSKNIMIEETRKQIELIERIDQSSMKYFKEIIGSAPIFEIPRDLEALDYSDLLELWHRLHTYNNKKTELVLLKCKDILSGWMKQYKSLPAHYLNIFNPLFLVFEQALTELNQSLDTDKALSKFEFYINGAVSKAQEGLEKLKALFYNKVTVSLPRITEVIGEVSPEIHKVYSFLESTTSTKDQNLESIHRLIVETIHDYEYVLLAKLMELLSVSSRNLLRKISDLQSSGINTQNIIGEQLEVFTQLIQADSSDMMPVEMITQSFVELDKILKNEQLQKKLYEIVDSTNATAERILEFIQALGWKNAQNALMPHVVKIKQARSAITFWSFDLISNSAIEVLKSSKHLVKSIQDLEVENYEIYLTDLANNSEIPYYQSIQAVFESKLDICSQEIFPLNELYNSREKLQKTTNLSEIYSLLSKISKLKTQWQREWLPLISKWHLVLFLFISDYKPTKIEEERITYLANAHREIEETYNHKPMVQYLGSAVEYYIKNK